MKSHEGDLGREISKVYGMVCELRAGFSRALLELNQIQQGDTELQNQLEDTRHGCNKRSLHLESLVLSLKDELEEVRCQFRQLCTAQDRQPPENPAEENNEVDSNGQHEGAAVALPSSSVDGDLLINCYLQGLRVWRMTRQNTGTDVLSSHVMHSSLRRGRRRGVVEMLLKSEREYVSSLNQLYDKYKSSSTSATEKQVEFVKHVDQMLQRHLLFRNTLEERLTTDERSCVPAEAFLNLTGQNNKSFSEAYIGYASGLATILTTEFSTTLPQNNPQNSQEEKFRLLSLLFAPVSRIHAYLSIIQALLHSSGAGHADWCSLQESERVLWNLCTSCHMTLEKAGPREEGAGPDQGLKSRCCAESPDCGPSAFTKYCANTSADPANDTAGPGIDNTAHQRKFCRVGLSRTLPRPSGILRNAREYLCEPPPGGWTSQYMWGGSTRQKPTGPVCAPFPHHPIDTSRFLNPAQPVAGEGTHPTAVKNPNSSAGLAIRVCGSPGLNGRVYTSDPQPHRLDDEDTDCDLADASVFDFSSVTTCSPDGTLERLRGAQACDDEDDDEEDSQVPVLLKPSYTHNNATVQVGGSLRMPWQIPRRVPIPSEVRIGVQGKTRNPKVHRTPNSAFRPIWDPAYSQGDVTPAKENSVTFSSTNHIISQQQETDQSRSAYRCAGVQRAEAVWHDSEDSEGPCSTV